jgi:hypothetical protein
MSEPWSVASDLPEAEAAGRAPLGQTTPPRKRMLARMAGFLLVVLAASAVGFFVGRSSGEAAATGAAASASSSAAAKHSRLKDAYDECHSRDTGNTVELGDGGETIVIDTRSEYGSTFGMECALASLETPQSIRAQMSSTTAMMGAQDAEHDGIQYSWSYHPRNGVNMVITDAS